MWSWRPETWAGAVRRASLSTLIVEKQFPGGLVALTHEVENYPAIDRATGMEIAQIMEAQCRKFGTEFIFKEVIRVDPSPGPGRFTVSLSDGKRLEALAVVIATGSAPRRLPAKGEAEYYGKGVSYCATCDGAFFRDKRIVAVGGESLSEGLSSSPAPVMPHAARVCATELAIRRARARDNRMSAESRRRLRFTAPRRSPRQLKHTRRARSRILARARSASRSTATIASNNWSTPAEEDPRRPGMHHAHGIRAAATSPGRQKADRSAWQRRHRGDGHPRVHQRSRRIGGSQEQSDAPNRVISYARNHYPLFFAPAWRSGCRLARSSPGRNPAAVALARQ
jgi:hypothetical protein